MSGDLGPIVASPPEFWSSSLDHKTEQTVSNGVDLSSSQRELFQPLPSNHLEMSTQKTTANSHNVSMNASDFFKVHSGGAQNSSKSTVLFKGGGVRSLNPFDAPPKTFADPFPSLSGEGELFHSQHPVVTNPFHKAATSEAELFQAVKQDPPIKENLFHMSLLTKEDVFSPLSTYTPETFPRTVTRDLLQDFSGSEEPYTNSPSSQYNPFTDVSKGTPDILQPLPKDIASSSYPTSIFSSPSESSDVDKLPNVVLATPQGSEYNIPLATPVIQARTFSGSSGQSSPEMTRVRTVVVIFSHTLHQIQENGSCMQLPRTCMEF